MLQGLVSLLRNPREIVEHGQKILEGQSAGDILGSISGMIALPAHSANNSDKEEPVPPDFGSIPAMPALESCGLW